MIRKAISSYLFSLRRTLTGSQFLWAIGIAMFPPVLFLGIRSIGDLPEETRLQIIGVYLFLLIPGLVCIAGTLLWGTAAVQEEVENGTWPFFLTRPHGDVSLLFGKYLTALTWTLGAGFLSLAATLLVARPERFLALLLLMSVLILFSAFAFGAVFVFIGTIVPSRAMVVSIVYVIVLEFVASLIPAVINNITISYHLISLFGYGFTNHVLEVEFEMPELFSVADFSSPWLHVAVLVFYTVLFLVLTGIVLTFRELVTREE